MIRKLRIVFSILTLVLVLTSCGPPYDKAKIRRQKIAEHNQGEIVIAVAWPDRYATFVKGAQLAATEINRSGGVLNRPIKILLNTRERTVDDTVVNLRKDQRIATDIAESFAKNPYVIAAIGHRDSALAIAASVVYEEYGIVFLAQTAPNLNLTTHRFDYIFRMIPDNETMGEQLADFSYRAGYKSMVVLHERDQSGKELAASFTFNAVADYGTEIVLRRSFFSGEVDSLVLVSDLMEIGKFDAILAATSSPVATKIYQQSRDMGLMKPFIGGAALNNNRFWRAVEAWESSINNDKTSVPTVFNPNARIAQPFNASFQLAYHGEMPDYLAALAYDAINLIAYAINRSGAATPKSISKTLRYRPPCAGVAGYYKFRDNGEVVSAPLYFKSFRDGRFNYNRIQRDKIPAGKNVSAGTGQWDSKIPCRFYRVYASADSPPLGTFP